MTTIYCGRKDCIFTKPCPNPEFNTCGLEITGVNKDGYCEEYSKELNHE